MLGVPAQRPLGDGPGGVGAKHHRVGTDAERAMLPHRLDDDARIGPKPAAVDRPFGRRQSGAGKLQLGADLRQRVEPGIGAGARIRQSDRIEPRRHHRREPAVAADRIDQIEDEQRTARHERVDPGKIVVEADRPRWRSRAGRARRRPTSAAAMVSISSGRLSVAACRTGMKPAVPGIRPVSALACAPVGSAHSGQARHRGSCRSGQRTRSRSARRGSAGRSERD